MAGSYDYFLVVLSVLISLLASYSALDLAEQGSAAAQVSVRLAWWISGSIAMGTGIWFMHYTAMLAFQLPVAVWYHWPTVLLSLIAGIVASAVSLFVVIRTPPGWLAALAGGVLQGSGITAMHYIGMAAMRMRGMCGYSMPIVVLSWSVAIAGSLFSLRLIRSQGTARNPRMAVGALLMGAAISAMHYTGMAAVTFTVSEEAPDLSHSILLTPLGTAGIVTVTLIVLVAAFVMTLVNRVQERTAVLDGLFEQGPRALVLLNRENQVIRVNREFTAVFGYTQGEVQGRGLGELVVPSEGREEYQRYMKLMLRGQRVVGESVRQRKDGSRLELLVVRAPLSLPGGEIRGCVMYSDTTERKAALQALSKRLLEVQEGERRHIASELHDEIGQTLTGLRFLLRTSGDSPLEELRYRIQEARAVVDDLFGKIRKLSFDLRPADLDELGLLPALLTLIERYTAQTGVLVDFKHQGIARRFAPQVETAVYRVIQEALTNAARHAGVAELTAHIWMQTGKLKFQIEDRGCGFDPELALKAPRSSGLIGMRGRMFPLGGSVTIGSSPGAGTTIAVELPVDETAP